ncbi:hypothetical protein SUGI_0115090 [Cryptomeria japonica]|nr:hypothetical protein SUGI_0115090 [Cryptomeria japonica]
MCPIRWSERRNEISWNAMIAGYHGHARQVFDKMPKRDVVSWSAMISGYGMHGHVMQACWMRVGEHFILDPLVRTLPLSYFCSAIILRQSLPRLAF